MCNQITENYGPNDNHLSFLCIKAHRATAGLEPALLKVTVLLRPIFEDGQARERVCDANYATPPGVFSPLLSSSVIRFREPQDVYPLLFSVCRSGKDCAGVRLPAAFFKAAEAHLSG